MIPLKSRCSGWFARLLSQNGEQLPQLCLSTLCPVLGFRKPLANLLHLLQLIFGRTPLIKEKFTGTAGIKFVFQNEMEGVRIQRSSSVQPSFVLSSLFSRFMKSKYFENVDFLSAPLSSRLSFAWRSIFYGRDLLTGLNKMVGNGLSLKVWTDSWIRDACMRADL